MRDYLTFKHGQQVARATPTKGISQVTMVTLIAIWIGLPSIVAASSLTIDLCSFRGDSGQTYLEIYIDLPREEITMELDSISWFGALNMRSEIRRDQLSVATDAWTIDFISDNEPVVLPNQRVIDARIYRLPAGFYNILLSARDSLSGNSWTAHDTLTVMQRPADELTISDIELASHILPMQFRPKFSRGDFSLVPNPRRIYGGERSFLIYYIEIYPPDLSIPDEAAYSIDRWILNGVQDTVRAFDPKIKTGARSGFADLDTIDLAELSTGAYQLSISATDQDGSSATSSIRFYIYDKNRLPVNFRKAVNIKEVDEELAEINFLLTLGQRKLIRRMNPTEKQKFLDEFWIRYDDDLNTPGVPLRDEFRNRVVFADEAFYASRSPGHKTDRGRIYILYGAPTDKEFHPLEIDMKPFEIWTYDQLDGGVIFVFVDRSGLGEAALVHSTRRGEAYNPRWMELYVLRTGVDSRR